MKIEVEWTYENNKKSPLLHVIQGRAFINHLEGTGSQVPTVGKQNRYVHAAGNWGEESVLWTGTFMVIWKAGCAVKPFWCPDNRNKATKPKVFLKRCFAVPVGTPMYLPAKSGSCIIEYIPDSLKFP